MSSIIWFIYLYKDKNRVAQEHSDKQNHKNVTGRCFSNLATKSYKSYVY